jgi:hypothetical protein
MTAAELIACVESMQPSEKTRFCALLTDYFPPPMVVLAPDHDDRSELEELKKKARKAMRTNSQHMGIAPFPIKYEEVDPEVRREIPRGDCEAAAPIYAANLIVTKHEVSPDGSERLELTGTGPTCEEEYKRIRDEAIDAGVWGKLRGVQYDYSSEQENLAKLRTELALIKEARKPMESASATEVGPRGAPGPPPGNMGDSIVLTESAFEAILASYDAEHGPEYGARPIFRMGTIHRFEPDGGVLVLLPTCSRVLPSFAWIGPDGYERIVAAVGLDFSGSSCGEILAEAARHELLPELLAEVNVRHWNADWSDFIEAIALDHVVPFRVVTPERRDVAAAEVLRAALEQLKAARDRFEFRTGPQIGQTKGFAALGLDPEREQEAPLREDEARTAGTDLRPPGDRGQCPPGPSGPAGPAPRRKVIVREAVFLRIQDRWEIDNETPGGAGAPAPPSSPEGEIMGTNPDGSIMVSLPTRNPKQRCCAKLSDGEYDLA